MVETSAICRRPLEAFPQIRTRNVDALADSVARYYGKNTIALPTGAKGFDAHANHYQLRAVGLTYASHGARLQIELPTFGYFGQLLAYRGSAEAAVGGRTRVEISPKQSFVGTAGETLKLDYAASFEQLVVKIGAGALVQKLEAIGGEKLTAQLRFEPHSSAAQTKNLRRLIQFLIQQVDCNGARFQPVALAEIEQAIMVSFLCANRHTYSRWIDRQPSRAAPWQVHLVEEYIEANWDQPITVEALSIVTNSSARSIFHSFKGSRAYSPMDFVKDLRLRHASKMLSAPVSETSVTDVAFACGFGNLGHFANYYRQKFGELPSHTLNRARGTRDAPHL